MPPKKSIADFFKPFTIPKNRVPNYESEDEITVARPSNSPALKREELARTGSGSHTRKDPPTTAKRGKGRPRKDENYVSPTKSHLETRRLERLKAGSSTPVRQSPRKRVNAGDTGDETASSASVLSSPQSSQLTPTRIRMLDAVEVPSLAKPPVPPPQVPAIVPASATMAPTTSFSSFSTLSSVPMSSQSSSRRIVKNGVPTVTNSDSGSMSSSEDELADFASFLPHKKRKVTPQPEEPANAATMRKSTRLSDEKSRKQYDDDFRLPTPPPTTKYKHNLSRIVNQNKRRVASEAKIAAAEAYVQEAERQKQLNAQAEDEDVNAGSLAAAMTDNKEDYERMKAAIERTEAMKAEETFYFFRSEMPDDPAVDLSEGKLKDHGLGFLLDETKRRHACTSGFLAALASQKGLPVTLTSWIQQSLLTEESEELCESYVAILEALVESQWGVADPVFLLSEAYSGRTLRDASDQSRGRAQALPPNLKYIIKAMSALAPAITMPDQACALAELTLLNNDENVRIDIGLQILIENAMSAILEFDSPEKLQEVYHQATRQILHFSSITRHLLSRAIFSLPATTLRLHNLRRKLALHLILEAPADEDIPATSHDTAVRLLVKLKRHPDFAISESTNYTLLMSLTELLDIAIDSGFSDFAFLSSEPELDSAPAPTKSIFAAASAKPVSEAETAFNAQIDSLTKQLTFMKSRIRDAGTSHLKRTEAKSALDRLVVRLESSVRTRPKPRKNVFSSSVGKGSAGMGLDAFLKRAQADAKATVIDESAGAERVDSPPLSSGKEEDDEVEELTPVATTKRESGEVRVGASVDDTAQI